MPHIRDNATLPPGRIVTAVIIAAVCLHSMAQKCCKRHSKQRYNISVCSMEVGVLEVWNDIGTESESEVSIKECEDDLVMQKCIGSSSEEENITRQSSVAGPRGPSISTCSKRNPVVYEWKEISSDSKVRGTTACNVCFMVIFCAQKCAWLYQAIT